MDRPIKRARVDVDVDNINDELIGVIPERKFDQRAKARLIQKLCKARMKRMATRSKATSAVTMKRSMLTSPISAIKARTEYFDQSSMVYNLLSYLEAKDCSRLIRCAKKIRAATIYPIPWPSTLLCSVHLVKSFMEPECVPRMKLKHISLCSYQIIPVAPVISDEGVYVSST
jgi:hypothetical protein